MRVLVVEDVASLAEIVAEGLRDADMAVDVVLDGLEAVVKVDTNPYDVVVLDRDLPGLHGDAVCRKIAESADPAMVLMLTAADAPIERVAGLRLGADDYLTKPFDFDELVLRIRALARRKPRAHERILRVADIALDPLHHTATHAGVALDLSTNEFALLEVLLRAAPAPLSSEDLLEKVWDEHADPFTRTVAVTISRLRRKLGAPDVINTIPRVGYRVTATTGET